MFSWWKRKPSVVEGRREIPSLGSLFTFALPDTLGPARPDAIGESLMRFAERPKPYRAVLVDLKGQPYLLSSGDLTGLVMAGVDQENRRFVPCAVVAVGRAEEHLRELLKVTRLDRLDYLIVAPSESDALEAILRFVARVQDGA
jgi:hypothetical protein